MVLQDAMRRSEILMEALPYIKEYWGKKVVIKYGGAAMTDPALKDSVASDIVLMKLVGMNPVVVHGGGPDITELMDRLELPVKFVDGLRVTDEAAMEVVTMVLVGKVNRGIVSAVNRHGKYAVGLAGDDGGLILASKRQGDKDLGFVGDVAGIDTELLDNLIEDGFTPVIASVGVGEDGAYYNINADQVAAAIAAAVSADKLVFLTDVDGLYADFADKTSLISTLTRDECRDALGSGRVDKGMVPKLEGMLAALDAGVRRAHILNGTTPHALLLELFTDAGIGTMVTE
jgi:acetylglutamate kinase